MRCLRSSYAKRVVRKLAPSQRALLLLASEPVKVSANNDFGLCGNRYGVDPEWGLAGQRIVARFDPDDLAKPPVVCLLDGTVVGEAFALARRFDEQGAAQEFKRAQRQLRRLRREQMKVLQGIERLVDAAVAEPGLPVIRRRCGCFRCRQGGPRRMRRCRRWWPRRMRSFWRWPGSGRWGEKSGPAATGPCSTCD
jgi:hypothetical protein